MILDQFFSDSAIDGLKHCDVSGSKELENMHSGDLSKDSKVTLVVLTALLPIDTEDEYEDGKEVAFKISRSHA